MIFHPMLVIVLESDIASAAVVMLFLLMLVERIFARLIGVAVRALPMSLRGSKMLLQGLRADEQPVAALAPCSSMAVGGPAVRQERPRG